MHRIFDEIIIYFNKNIEKLKIKKTLYKKIKAKTTI